MTTLLYIDEQPTKAYNRDVPTTQLIEIHGEDVRNFARGRIWADVSKQRTKDGIVTTINVTFYDADNSGILAIVHGHAEGVNLYLHGDFSKDFSNLTISGGVITPCVD